MSDLNESRRRLDSLLRGLEQVVVAFSGGIDSTLVLKLAHEALGDKVIAATAVSSSLARQDLNDAQRIAAEIGVKHVLLESSEVEDPRYRKNDTQRCYFCKSNVYDTLIRYAGGEGLRWILDGTNADDTGDHRPGLRAAREHGVRSPLQECGLGKEQIRALAKEAGLSNWAKPANACLSSRIPYGSEVTPEKLSQVETAEAALRKLGFTQLRVRHHGTVARIEVPKEELKEAVNFGDAITEAVREAGFQYATIDLEGFRSGSMNEGPGR
ncbi:MAG: ATP-dependent sacrificial sulfur transferase LarE [Akkermansiaceae bacterium]|nr:ATP-dependent sacrificial sulfur transferase LarE [Akkermansiaceae bacterium]